MLGVLLLFLLTIAIGVALYVLINVIREGKKPNVKSSKENPPGKKENIRNLQIKSKNDRSLKTKGIQPEEVLQAGTELCQNGNLTGGIEKFREALKCNPRPGTRMVLNHNLALALSMVAGVVWGPGGRVPVKNDNIEYLDEAVKRWDEVCKIYQNEVKGTSEEKEFSAEPSLKEYMKTAMNNSFAIHVKLEQFRGRCN